MHKLPYRKSKPYEKREHHLIKGDYAEIFPKDQWFSVEASLETMIPWIEYIESLMGKKVLIFGTGLGGTAVACALNIGDGKVYGIDISRDAIEKTALRAELYGVKDKLILEHMTDTYPLNYKENFFDIVILADVIEHIVAERRKYVREAFRVLKKGGLFIITGTPNSLYAKDRHTTNLYFIPWMSKSMAYRYAILRNKWDKDKDLDYAGRKGTTFWHIRSWLKGFNYEILNTKNNFTSEYLSKSGRINSTKRKVFFTPYKFFEKVLSFFNIPITAFLPYINHLFIRKK